MKNYKKIHNMYFAEGEEKEPLLRHILPEYFIERNLHSNAVNEEYAINFMQNELNSILSSFINGGFSRKGFMLYPMLKDVSKENIAKINGLKHIAEFLNQKGFDFSASIGKYPNKPISRSFALLLSNLYRDFSRIINKNVKSARKPRCAELKMEAYRKEDSKYLKPLDELKKYSDKFLKQHLSGFYLHGSLATNDYIKGWSDVDTISIISKETTNDPEALLKLRERLYRARYFFYKIDPLQHHGSIVISEYDMASYCNAYFPIPVFKYAKSFFEEDAMIHFKERDYSSEALARLFWFVSYFRKLKEEKRFDLGSYDLKTLLHSITLFPAMYLQSKGILVYKKFSFAMARKDFSSEDWKVIDDVSSIRLNWSKIISPDLPMFSRINPLLYYQANSRISDLFKNIKKANNIDEEELIRNMHRLSEKAWGKTKKTLKNLLLE